MTSQYPPLSHIPLRAGATFERPREMPRLVHRDDPALDVMTDFHDVVPVTIGPDSSIDFALEKMKSAGVRLLLVIDGQRQVLGVISAADIQGDRPIKYSQEHRVSRSRITVGMVMTPQSALEVLNYISARGAQVGHIESTLHQLARQHVLVVEVDDDGHRVRGLYSMSEIARRLGEDAKTDVDSAHSLAEIVQELK